MNNHECRFCKAALTHTFADLGTAPPCNKIVTDANFNRAESTYPLHVYVCDVCHLVQLPAYVAREDVFDENYSYFSSFSQSWLRHAEGYVEKMVERFGFNEKSRVVELASNDGYLLQFFKQRGIPCLGIEPTANTAAAARAKGINTMEEFFGRETAGIIGFNFGKADLILGNNVLAHVPDINDFVAGIKHLLDPVGVVTMEFPSLLNLVKHNYFDTIYHEHFSYLSFTTVREIFYKHGLELFHVEELLTHGGSLRIYGRHVSDHTKPVLPSVGAMISKELNAGHFDSAYYDDFASRVKESKRRILDWFIGAKRSGAKIAAFGAPGKGNTLLNYCGIRTDFLECTVDDSPHKQGNYLPGSRIPIYAPEALHSVRPDYVVILPWNLKQEISQKLNFIRQWGGQCVVLLPDVEVLP